ncbi:hypothetical protein CONCODRAFT_1927 [Conidiobolus coronatus NRRL 28638]|uniref:CsbD-like domain-containing protein n=1 Tax=Conidiobolus coronatus (strain ATCC 28846 / CBS 209.66 / NRRL 28638) TaxID=796925 RepID=A0A137PIP0_CONC2|nr:hypothetical protein CONCODRAFT_1927 [Conidiobolus coronatus NRRL 28638]|eukprot:KXN74863.1 hypothetical protein CONCODRAFT_1927 [Conidiobolus coronatus NRRL 28638]
MSEPNKTDVAYNKAMDSAKEDFGYITGSKELEVEGCIQKQKGEAERAAADTEGNSEGATETFSAEGKAQQLKSDAQKSLNH